MSELVQVFYDPGKVFDAVRDRGKWIPAFLAVCVAGILIYFAMVELIGAGNIARMAFAGNPRLAAMVPAEAIAQAAVDAEKPARKVLGLFSAGVGQAISLLFLGGLFTGLIAIMDKRPGYLRMVGAISYAWFPVSVVSGILMVITLMLSTDRTSVDPQNLVATNISMFLSDETSKPLRTFVGAFDLLSFVRIGLMAFGISRVAQIPFRHGLGVVVGVWALYVLARVAISFVF